jgi:hypothetical protein
MNIDIIFDPIYSIFSLIFHSVNIHCNVKVNNYKEKIDLWENTNYLRYHTVTMH